MDYSKFFRKEMPLAVPHQKPPSKYASHPYPFLIDEDACTSTIRVLDITLELILKDATINDVYQPDVMPLDIFQRSILINKHIDENEAHTSTVRPLDITLKSLLISKYINDDVYQSSVKPLNITLNSILITHRVYDIDAYTSEVKPLDITKHGI